MIKYLIMFLIFSGYSAVSIADLSQQALPTSKLPLEELRDKQYQYLLNKIFKVTSKNIEKKLFSRKSKNKAKFEYLKDYQASK